MHLFWIRICTVCISSENAIATYHQTDCGGSQQAVGSHVRFLPMQSEVWQFSHMNLAEAAVLAGLFKAPSSYAPHVNLEAARERAGVVMGRMLDVGYLLTLN
jgi:membrane peptidoglycan carboxypeptidase